jgi:hypothetical protein
MFWPFPGLLVPTMTSASNNQYRQPRFRVQLSQFDAVYRWSKVFLGQKTILPPGISGAGVQPGYLWPAYG